MDSVHSCSCLVSRCSQTQRVLVCVSTARTAVWQIEKELADEKERLVKMNEKVRLDAAKARQDRKRQVVAARTIQRAFRKWAAKKRAAAKQLYQLEQNTRVQIQALKMQQEQDLLLYQQQLAQMQWIIEQQRMMTEHMQLVNQQMQQGQE